MDSYYLEESSDESKDIAHTLAKHGHITGVTWLATIAALEEQDIQSASEYIELGESLWHSATPIEQLSLHHIKIHVLLEKFESGETALSDVDLALRRLTSHVDGKKLTDSLRYCFKARQEKIISTKNERRADTTKPDEGYISNQSKCLDSLNRRDPLSLYYKDKALDDVVR